MNKRTLFSLFVILLLGTIQINAQSVRTLTLEESIEIAKDNSPLSRAATFSLIASKWRYKSFRADLLPSLELAGNIPNYRLGAQTVNTTEGIQNVSFNNSNANLGLSINQAILPTGGSVSVTSSLNRLGIFKGEKSYEWSSTPISIVYNQPLFQYNNLKWRNRIEPLRFRIAEKQFVEDLEDLSFTVTQSFFDVLISKINVEIADFNVTVNDSIYNICLLYTSPSPRD